MSTRATMPASTPWLSIQSAADLLGLTAAALRKSLERRAVRSPDGGTEAEIDGVRGRKLGRLWRVSLSAAWSNAIRSVPAEGVHSPRREGAGNDRERDRS